jgi:hypothetical protein
MKGANMKTTRASLILSAACLGVLSLAPDTSAQVRDRDRIDRRDPVQEGYWGRYGREVQLNDLPREVRQSIRAEVDRGGEIDKIIQYTRNDRTYYRVTMTEGRQTRVAIFNNQGTYLREFNDTEEGRQRITYRRLPENVQRGLLRAAGTDDFDRIVQTTRNGQTVYIADFDYRGDPDRVVVNSNGRVIQSGESFTRDRDGRRLRDDSWTRRNSSDLRARMSRYEDGERLTYENLPGEVKQTIGREMGARSEVVDVRKITRSGQDVYRVDVEDGSRLKTLAVTENGQLLREANTTEEGRTRVSMNELPGPVKSTFAKAAQNKDYRRVYQMTEDRETWYVGYLDSGEIVRVASDGDLLSRPTLASDRAETRTERLERREQRQEAQERREERRERRDDRQDRRDDRRDRRN